MAAAERGTENEDMYAPHTHTTAHMYMYHKHACMRTSYIWLQVEGSGGEGAVEESEGRRQWRGGGSGGEGGGGSGGERRGGGSGGEERGGRGKWEEKEGRRRGKGA